MANEIEQLKQFGLFAAPLNNGDWMVGHANVIYSINIDSEHYEDERLSIASTLIEAINKWVNRNKKKAR